MRVSDLKLNCTMLSRRDRIETKIFPEFLETKIFQNWSRDQDFETHSSCPLHTISYLCYTLCSIIEIRLVEHVGIMEEHMSARWIITVQDSIVLDVLGLYHLEPLRVVPAELLCLYLLGPGLVKFLQSR